MIFNTDDIKQGDFKKESYDGYNLPRITKILSFIDSEGLVDWANAIGRKGINNKSILKEAANIGSLTHESIEKFLKTEEEPVDRFTAFESFKMWYNDVWVNNHVEILGQEETLSCDLFMGTYDLLLKINGKIYLMDFKTSNHVSYKYCMQLAAYRYMLRLNKNMNVDGCIILQLNKTNPGYNEFFLNFDNPEHLSYINDCEEAFLMLAMLYHKMYWVKNNYPF